MLNVLCHKNGQTVTHTGLAGTQTGFWKMKIGWFVALHMKEQLGHMFCRMKRHGKMPRILLLGLKGRTSRFDGALTGLWEVKNGRYVVPEHGGTPRRCVWEFQKDLEKCLGA